MKPRSRRLEYLASIYDKEVLPLWTRPFAQMVLEQATLPERASVLEVDCASGYLTFELLRRLDERGRIVGLETMCTLLDVAREKAGHLLGKRVFFRSEDEATKLDFADNVFDVVVSNLGLFQHRQPLKRMQEFVRVVKPHGQVIVTLPLAGSFVEFYDLFREVLIRNDYYDQLQVLEEQIASLPDASVAATRFVEAGLENVETNTAEFQLYFRSGREFFFSPLIEFGPLPLWQSVISDTKMMQDVFWQIKDAMDTYFSRTPFSLTVRAGSFQGNKAPWSALQPVILGMLEQPEVFVR